MDVDEDNLQVVDVDVILEKYTITVPLRTVHTYIMYGSDYDIYNSHCCVVVFFFPFILDIRFVGRTSGGHTGFFIHLPSAVRASIFLARSIQPFLSLVDREVEFLCTNDLTVLHSLGILFFIFHFLVRKIPFTGIELTSQRVRRL